LGIPYGFCNPKCTFLKKKYFGSYNQKIFSNFKLYNPEDVNRKKIFLHCRIHNVFFKDKMVFYGGAGRNNHGYKITVKLIESWDCVSLQSL